MPTGGRSWFLGIGINQYRNFPSLTNAVKDVKDLVLLLQTEYDLLPEYTFTLFDEAATRRNIIVTLDDLQGRIGPEDKLLIYYSGHGHLNKTIGKGYWIPTDAESSNTADYIRNSTIREYIETFPSLHTLLISDSCFSGTLFVRGASRSSEALRELAGIPSRWAICSGRHDQAVYDGEPGKNSPFAESIMDALRRNHQPVFNVAKLINSVIEQTRSNYEQLPEGNPLYGVGHKGGQYIFLKKHLLQDNWESVRQRHSISAYIDYLEDYPDGIHAEEARRQIHLLEEAHEQSANSGAVYHVHESGNAPAELLRTRPDTPLLADASVKRLRKAFLDLMERTNSDAFIIVQEALSKQFVQFSGGAEQELLFNLPTVALDSDVIARAMMVLKDYGIGLTPSQYYTDSSMTEKMEAVIDFNQKIGRDPELAIELVSRVMMEVYGFDREAEMELIEN